VIFGKELELAKAAARKAGGFLRSAGGGTVESSAGKDIKLREDREAEKIILDMLAEHSEHPALAEESGMSAPERSGPRWIVDPLDGSYNYYRGMRELCAVSIALWDGDKPVLGVVHKFCADEMYEGLIGHGAFLNGRPLVPSRLTELSQAVCATGLSVKGGFDARRLEEYIRLFQVFKKVRMLGAASLMSVYVGAGKVDVYQEKDILLWDIAAGAAVSLAAGAVAEIVIKDSCKCDVALCANTELHSDYYAVFSK
jgi:myo-inositol-1(or 4)-monophosphatase